MVFDMEYHKQRKLPEDSSTMRPSVPRTAHEKPVRTIWAAWSAGQMSSRAAYVSSFILGLAVWQLVAGLLPHVVFASPSRVAEKLYAGVLSGEIPAAFLHSLQQFALGFAISFMIALPLGLLLGRSRIAFAMFNPALNALLAVPSVAFVPFIMIWFGLFFEARVALVVVMSVLDMTVIIMSGARNIDPAAVTVAKSFQITGFASNPFCIRASKFAVSIYRFAHRRRALGQRHDHSGTFLRCGQSRQDHANGIEPLSMRRPCWRSFFSSACSGF